MKQAARRKFHYIYKITRVDESGKYYIGMHSTDDLDDEYFGSGKLITRSINRHGKDKHSKEILEFLPTRETLKLREKELVNEDLLLDKRCMNLRLGGEGGGKFKDAEHQIKCSTAGVIALQEKMKDPEYRLAFCKKRSDASKRRHNEGKLNSYASSKNPWRSLNRHTLETLEQLSTSQKAVDRTGDKNPMFGKKFAWISKQGEVKRILLEDLDQHLGDGWIRGIKR